MATKQWKSVQAVSEAEDQNGHERNGMQDKHLAIDNFAGVEGQGLFCVFDGHGEGKKGVVVAEYLQDHFPALLEKNLGKSSGCFKSVNIEAAMSETFAEIDKSDVVTAEAHRSVGSTAACCLIKNRGKNKRYLYVANVGDTRAVLSRGDEVIMLTTEHNVGDQKETAESINSWNLRTRNEMDEKDRLFDEQEEKEIKMHRLRERQRIVNAEGLILHNRVLGLVSPTRSVGDHALKQYLISEPSQQSVRLTGGEMLIVACDGVWDVMSNRKAVQFVKQGISSGEFKREEAAERLVAYAVEESSTDNITALVIFL